MKVMPEILSYSDVGFLPIVAAFVKKIGVAEEVDRLCAMESDVRPGVAVSAMILDTLSGRSPLYRFDRFCAQLDTELLLFCFSRNWTIPHYRLAYDREGGIGGDQKEEEFFSRGQSADSPAASY
jgi:hypothetical protein